MCEKEIKVITCYERWNEQGELVGKVMSAGFEDGKIFQKLQEATIKTRYNTEKEKEMQSWLRNLYDTCKINELLETIQICRQYSYR